MIFLITTIFDNFVKPCYFTKASKSIILFGNGLLKMSMCYFDQTGNMASYFSTTWQKCYWLQLGIYPMKRNPDGSITRHKAPLVAKGYHQTEAIVYGETFRIIVKKPTIQIIFSLAAQCDWPIRQLDVKNAFLHGGSS